MKKRELCKLIVQAFLGKKWHPAYHIHPYHFASNGLAERSSRSNCQARAEKGNLDDWLARLLFSYRTTPHSTTGVTPAELVLGRNP